MIAVMTNNNAPGLRKTLKSYLDRGVVPVVFDSTADAPGRNDNKALIRSLERDFRVKIRYASYREVASYAKELIKEGSDSELIEYAFLGGPSGFWNAALLDGSPTTCITFVTDTIQYRPVLVGSDEVEIRQKSVEYVTDSKPERSRNGEINPVYYMHHELSNWDKSLKGRVVAVQSGWLGDYHTKVENLPLTEYKCAGRVVVQPVSFLRRHCLDLEYLPAPPLVPEEALSSGPRGESVYGPILELSLALPYVAHLPQCLPSSAARKVENELPSTEALRFLLNQAASKEEALELIENANWEEVCEEAEGALNLELLNDWDNLTMDPFIDTLEIQKPELYAISRPEGFSKYALLWKSWSELRKSARIVKDKGFNLTVEL